MCKEEIANRIPSPWLTLAGAAEYLHMSRERLTTIVRSGAIPSYRRGRTTFVHVRDLDTWMRSLPSGASPLSMVVDGSISVA